MFSAVGIIVNCVSIFFKPIVQSMHFTRAEFSLYFTFITLSMIIGVLLGSIFDKFGSRTGMIYACLIFILAAIVLMQAKSAWVVFLFAVLFGLANPMATITAPFITAEIFGPKDYGVIYGAINIFFTLGLSIGMPLSGAIFDARDSYLPAFSMYAVLAALVAVIISITISREKASLKNYEGI